MLDLIFWVGVGLAVLFAAALVSIICHDAADDRREWHIRKHGGTS